MCHPLKHSNIIHRRRKRGGDTGDMCPPRFCSKQRSALYQKMAPFLRKKCPQSVVPRAAKNIFLSGNLVNAEKFSAKSNYVVQNTDISAGHDLLKRSKGHSDF